jgi:phage shock protein PspC (stress-responsive transcriptional regulator)
MTNLFRDYGLYRDPAQGWIAGVAAGLARRFGVSAGVLRIAFVLLALAGTPILALAGYVVLAVLMPTGPVLLDRRSDRSWWYR